MASEPQELATDVSAITQTVFSNGTAKPDEARNVLKFISQLVQVVDDALGEVMATMIDFKYVTPNDLRSDWGTRTAALEKLLTGRTYRAAADICDRLEALEQRYYEHLAPTIEEVSNVESWNRVFSLLQQHEGGIVRLVDDTVESLCAMAEEATEGTLPDIRAHAKAKVDEIRRAIDQLRDVRNEILGLSGSQGMLELLGSGAAASTSAGQKRTE
jgi:hypothetical protein